MKKTFKISAVVLMLVVLIVAAVAIAVNAAAAESWTNLADPTASMTAMNKGGKFKLTADLVSSSAGNGVEIGKDVTLDLNGHTWTINYENGAFHSGGNAGGNNTFTVIDSVGGGAIICAGPLFEARTGVANIDGGTIVVTGGKMAADGCDVTVLFSGHGKEYKDGNRDTTNGTTWVNVNPNLVNTKTHVADHYWGYLPNDTENPGWEKEPAALSKLPTEHQKDTFYQILPKQYKITYMKDTGDGNLVEMTEDERNGNNQLTHSIDTPAFSVTAPKAPKGYENGKGNNEWKYKVERTDNVEKALPAKITGRLDSGEPNEEMLFNLIIIAHFTPKTYTIEYKLDGAKDPGNPTTYTMGEDPFTLLEPKQDGATFKGWFIGETQVEKLPDNNFDYDVADNKVIVEAHFDYIQYEIKFEFVNDDEDGETFSLPGQVTFPQVHFVNKAVSFPTDDVKAVLKDSGYSFDHWTLNGETLTEIEERTHAEDVTIVGHVKYTEYTIEYQFKNPQGSTVKIRPDNFDDTTVFPRTYKKTSGVIRFPGTSTVTMGMGYEFHRFEDVNGNSVTEFKAEDNLTEPGYTVTCVVDYIYYTIEWYYGEGVSADEVENPNRGNEIEPGTGHFKGHVFTIDDDITLKPATRANYDFVEWTDQDGNKIEGWKAGDKTFDMKLTAHWTPHKYKITYPDLTGVDMPEDYVKEYTVEDDVELPKMPTKRGYYFAGWLIGDEVVKGWKAGERDGDITLRFKEWTTAEFDFHIIYKVAKEYQEENGISDEDAILYEEDAAEFLKRAFGETFDYEVLFSLKECNGFVPYLWHLYFDEFPDLRYDEDIPCYDKATNTFVIYFMPVVMKTELDGTNLVVTYSNGKTKTVDLSSFKEITVENGKLVYKTTDGNSYTLATAEDVSKLETDMNAKIDALNKEIADLKAALTSLDGKTDAALKEQVAQLTAKINELSGVTEQHLAAIQEQVDGIDTSVPTWVIVLLVIIAVVAVAALAWTIVITFKKKA